jgi:drug/metabolite transporter (DMT)-like permease
MGEVNRGASRGWIITAFATVYIVWGSTYLGIQFAIESFPPFLMAATRFIIAGTLMFTILQIRQPTRTTPREWLSTAIAGALMLAGANGLVCWAEQTVPSGLAALIVGTTPLWMVLLDWLFFGGSRPTVRIVLGLAVGLGGVGLLVGPQDSGDWSVDPAGAVGLLCACLLWATGSLGSRRMVQPRSPFLSVSMQMLCGGVVLLLIGTLLGEWGPVSLAEVKLSAVIALAYLIVFGAIVGLTAYMWLLRVCNPAHVATYAYVNPVVAVILGALLASEPVTMRTILGSLLIIGAVMLVTLRPRAKDLRPMVEKESEARRSLGGPVRERPDFVEEPVA